MVVLICVIKSFKTSPLVTLLKDITAPLNQKSKVHLQLALPPSATAPMSYCFIDPDALTGNGISLLIVLKLGFRNKVLENYAAA